MFLQTGTYPCTIVGRFRFCNGNYAMRFNYLNFIYLGGSWQTEPHVNDETALMSYLCSCTRVFRRKPERLLKVSLIYKLRSHCLSTKSFLIEYMLLFLFIFGGCSS